MGWNSTQLRLGDRIQHQDHGGWWVIERIAPPKGATHLVAISLRQILANGARGPTTLVIYHLGLISQVKRGNRVYTMEDGWKLRTLP